MIPSSILVPPILLTVSASIAEISPPSNTVSRIPVVRYYYAF